jgi:hypothetical protein
MRPGRGSVPVAPWAAIGEEPRRADPTKVIAVNLEATMMLRGV